MEINYPQILNTFFKQYVKRKGEFLHDSISYPFFLRQFE